MKRFYIITIILTILVILTGCVSQPTVEPTQDVNSDTAQNEMEKVDPTATAEPMPTQTESTPAWQASSPIAEFEEKDIDYLGIQCSGTDLEIAECIKDWQVENILYCVSASGEDLTPTCSALVETNEVLPGILTSKDVIYNQLYDGRINGLCMDYAAVYCSIAEFYGIQCRVVRSATKFCDEVNCDDDDEPGWDEISYKFFIKPLMDKHELPYTLEAVNSVAEDTWAHYWAEVLIDGEWEFMDASARDTARRYAQNAVVVVDWKEMDKSDEMVAFLNQ